MSKHEKTRVQPVLSAWLKLVRLLTPQSGECETNAYQGVTIEIIPVKRMFSFLDARQDTQCTPHK